MFTGIIEHLGAVDAVDHAADVSRLTVSIPDVTDLRDGESVAVNGACLTATTVREGTFGADVSAETLRRTTLGSLRVGDAVHIERSLRIGDRLGGHFVQGHVDEVATIRALAREGASTLMDVDVARESRHYLVEKCSISLDGVSLTIASLTADGARIAVIPYTLASTTFQHRRVGDRLNVEFDMLAKYVARLLGPSDGRDGSRLDEAFLQRHGYA